MDGNVEDRKVLERLNEIKKENAKFTTPPKKQKMVVKGVPGAEKKKDQDQDQDEDEDADPMIDTIDPLTGMEIQLRLSEMETVDLHPEYEGPHKKALMKRQAELEAVLAIKRAKEHKEKKRFEDAFENGKIRRPVTGGGKGEKPYRVPKDHPDYDKWEDVYNTVYEHEFDTTVEEEEVKEKKRLERVKRGAI